MKKWTSRFKKWFVSVSDMPADVVMDLPKVTMIGQCRLSIENHNGIIVFSENELRLALNQGELIITGDSFVLETLLEKEIYLEGRIKEIRYFIGS